METINLNPLFRDGNIIMESLVINGDSLLDSTGKR